jgi:HAAS
MAESRPAELYLQDLAQRMAGSRRTRRRLLAELRDHVDDAVAAQLDAGVDAAEAERHAIARLGPPDALARAWRARCVRVRTRRRGRAAMLAGATALAAVLAVTQHADGRSPTAPTACPSGGAHAAHCAHKR